MAKINAHLPATTVGVECARIIFCLPRAVSETPVAATNHGYIDVAMVNVSLLAPRKNI
jgi:hypothetical protein